MFLLYLGLVVPFDDGMPLLCLSWLPYALAAAGYAYRHVYALDQKHCAMSNDATQNLWTETIADTLVWMWDGYEQAPGSDPNGPV